MRDRFLRVKPGYDYAVPTLRRFGDRSLDLGDQLAPRIPELGVHVVRQGTVVAPGWVLDRRGRPLGSTSWHGAREKGPTTIRTTHDLGGTAITLGTTWGHHYGHLVPDGIARLGLVPAKVLRRADRILVPHIRKAEQARLLLDRLGIADRVVEMERFHAYRVDTLYAPTFPGLRRQYDPVVPETMRGAMPPPSGERRLFVTRRGYTRNPTQLDDVERLAVRHGFEIYDPMTSADQALDFRNASAVAGASGSGLTGIGYMAPGAKVLELFSDAHVFAYYASLSAAAQLDYGYVMGRSDDVQRAKGASKADFSVDLDAVDAGLAWAGS